MWKGVGALGAVVAIILLILITPASRSPPGDPPLPPRSGPEAHLRLGHDRERAFDLEGALQAYAEAIRLDPFLLEAHLGYQEIMHLLWRGHELPGHYRQLRDRWPESALHRFLFAHAVARRTLNWRETVALYDEAIALDPTFPLPFAYRYEKHTFPDPADLGPAVGSAQRCSQLAPRLAACHEELARFADAAEDFETAAGAYETALAADSTGRKRPLLYLGLAESQAMLGRPDAALATLESAFKEFSGPGQAKGKFDFYTDLEASIRTSWRDPRWSPETVPELVDYRQRALAHIDALERIDTIPALRDRLTVWQALTAPSLGDDERGLALLSQAIADSARFRSSNRTAYLRRERCELLRVLQELEKARVDCVAALEVFRATADSLELRRVLRELIHVEEERGQLVAALDVAREHLAVSRRNGNDGHAVTALHDLGWIAWKAGDSEGARSALQGMADIASAKDRWLYEAAEFYEAIGDYHRALEFFYRGARDSTSSARRAYGSYGRSVLGLSRVHLRLGDIPGAFDYGQEYDAYVRSVGTVNLPFPNLAGIHRARGRADEAVRYAEAWLAEAERRGSASTAAQARRELALSQAAGGRPGEAVIHLRSILGQYEAMDRFLERGAVFLKLAEAYLGTGTLDSASAFVDRAADHARLTRDAETAWYTEFVRGKLFEATGEEDRALSVYEGAIGRIEEMYGRVPTDDLRSWFLVGRLGPYDAAIRLLLTRDDDLSKSEAFRLSEKKKAQALLELVRSGNIEPNVGGSGALLQRKAGIEARLDVARGRLRAEYERTGDRQQNERVATLTATVDSLQALYAKILQKTRQSPTAAGDLAVDPPTPGRLRQSVLSPDRALIEYTLVKDQLVAFVVSARAMHAVRLEATADDIAGAVERIRAPLEAWKRGDLGLAQVEWDIEAASQLYQDLVRPLEMFVGDATDLIVIPEGILWHVPFDALVVRPPSESVRGGPIFRRYEETEFLLDHYTISYAPSAALLDPALWPPRETAGELLVLADPRTPPALQAASPVAFARAALRRLPGARAEAEAIAREVDGAAVLVGDDASEAAFYEKAPAYRMIHLATHGLVDERVPLYSRLALTPSPTSDGSLHAYELFDTRLSAELVVLSACETGVGRLRAGEGMLALNRAFMAAGVPSLVVTQWVVPDESQSPLMPEFYRALEAGRPKARALREAKLATKSTHIAVAGQTVSLAHPIYWAPFIFVGLPN
ncbi:MAG: CHAT domain-containing protein [Gemmatimonadetes bacterium]|nr:CHAT domain-containing protein [Gemmatimonadota bacterium]